jgi:hypothetical protein
MSTDLHIVLSNVNGGEISPQLEARDETDKYKASARVLENFIVKPYGAISKRPGTEYLGTTKNNQVARLEPFKRSVESNYMLEFTDKNIRIWKNAQPLTVSASDISLSWSNTPWTANTTYSANQIIYSGIANNLFFQSTTLHTSTSANQPTSGTAWNNNWNYFNYNQGNIINYYNPSVSANQVYYCNQTVNTFNHPPSATDYWTQLPSFSGNSYYIDIKTPYLWSEIFDLQTIQLNDVMFIAQQNHLPLRLSKYSDTNWILDNVPFDFAPALDVNDVNTGVQIKYNYLNWDQGYVQWLTATPYTVGQVVYDSNVDYLMYKCKLAHTSGSTTRPGSGASWTTYWTVVYYNVGDRVVNSNNLLYTATVAHYPKFVSTYAQGQPGITTGTWINYWNLGGSSVFPSTPWSSSYGIYNVGQVVTHVGLTFRCIEANYSTSTEYEPGVGVSWTRPWVVIPNSANIIGDVQYTLIATSNVFTPNDINNTWLVPVGVSTNYATINLGGSNSVYLGPTASLFVQGSYLITTMWSQGYAPIGVLTLEQSNDNINWQIINTWNITNTTDNNISHSNDAPPVGAWYRLNAIKSSGGQYNYKIESVNSVINLSFKINGYISASQVSGRVVMPNNQDAPSNIIGISTATFKKPAFSPESGYPKTVAYHESRIWWGGIASEPGRLWASQIENFYTYLLGSGATDALDITLGSTATNKILWAKSFNKTLVVGTEGEIFTVDSGTTDLGINAGNIRARLTIRSGCSTIPAIVTGDTLLFVQRGNKRLREFSYTFANDAFTAPDMTLYAEHISQDGFIQVAYQTNLEPVLWAVTKKGALAGFSYDRSQNITAWHRHITGDRLKYYSTPTSINDYPDKFTSVATMYGNSQNVDEVWFIVRRVVNGQFMNYVERFNPEIMNFVYGNSWNELGDQSMWKYLDCVSTQTSNSIISGNTVYGGFNQLEGRTVDYTAFGGQNYTNTQNLITSGNLTLSGTSNPSNINAGLPIFSVYVPPRLEIQLPNGSIQGRKTRLNRIMFKLWRSYGGQYKTYNNDLTSATIAQNSYELKPLITDNFDKIDYSNFLYGLSFDYPRPSTINHDASFTGQTVDQHINTDWNENLLFAVVHNDARPFNLLGMIWKAEISGN